MVSIRHELDSDALAIEQLLNTAFGSDRHGKVSYRYREGIEPEAALSMVAEDHDQRLIGTIRYWQIELAGHGPALLLGPLAIHPEMHGRGIGRALVFTTLDLAGVRGHRIVMLVGDPAYYRQFGFAVAPPHIVMPGESPARLQYRALDGAALPAKPTVILRRRCPRRALGALSPAGGISASVAMDENVEKAQPAAA